MAMAALARQAAQDVNGRVIVVDHTGLLVADSEDTTLLGTPYGDRPEIVTALEGRTAQGRRQSETLDEELLYTAVPGIGSGQRVGAVRITQGMDQISAKIRRDVLVLAGIGTAALIVGLAVAWVIAGSIAGPMRRLSRAAERVAAGDLGTRAEVSGSKEHREVAAAFNDMTGRLGRVLEAQREFVANASHQLRTPLTGLRLRLEAASLKSSDPKLRRELEAAEHEVDRLARLLTGLLTLARGSENPVLDTSIPLAEAAEGAFDRWHRTAESEGRRLVLAGDGLVPVSGQQPAAATVTGPEESSRSTRPPLQASAWIPMSLEATARTKARAPQTGMAAPRETEAPRRTPAAASGVAATRAAPVAASPVGTARAEAAGL
jgi:signal transduction histidine kinase